MLAIWKLKLGKLKFRIEIHIPNQLASICSTAWFLFSV